MKSLVLIFLSAQCFATSRFGGLDTQETIDNEAPKFCGKHECPDFTVVKKYEDYELRQYNASVWVTVEMPVMEENYWDDRNHVSEPFMKLFHYIQGHNKNNMTMDMTAPVLKTHMKDSVIMGFMLPTEHSHQPPTPTDPKVSIYRSPGGSVFVRSFGGFAYGLFDEINRYKLNMAALEMDLKKDGQSFDTSVFYTAGYNGPREFFNRHNEVWINKQ